VPKGHFRREPTPQEIFENVDNTAFMVPNSRLDGTLIPFLGTFARSFGAGSTLWAKGVHSGGNDLRLHFSGVIFFSGDYFASGATRIGDHSIIRSFGL
jgi:hypothetical protein